VGGVVVSNFEILFQNLHEVSKVDNRALHSKYVSFKAYFNMRAPRCKAGVLITPPQFFL
jgi:SUMO ligase MMS21 Smc5/6 complex component